MKHYTLIFTINYADGSSMEGITPYRGDERTLSLDNFIRGYFAGTKKVFDIQCKILDTFDSPKEWISAIKDLETYDYLFKVNSFAAELLKSFSQTILKGKSIRNN